MTGKSLPFLPLFPRDFIAATLGWTMEQRGLYITLMCAEWELGSLPADQPTLANVAGATLLDFARVWKKVHSKFVDRGDGELVNSKLEEHRSKSLKLKTVRSEAGKKGGKAKANRKAKGLSNGLTKSYPPSPSPSPSSDPSPTPVLERQLSVVPPDPVVLVFQHWQREWGKGRSALDPKRRALIAKALKAYPIQELFTCISGYRNSDFHRGQNDRNTVYDDIGLFLRDSSKIDQGIKFADAPVAVQERRLRTAAEILEDEANAQH